MLNPFFTKTELPSFNLIKPKHIVPAITEILKKNTATVNSLLNNGKNYTWENLIAPLEEVDDQLNYIWSIISHLNMVNNSKEIREAYKISQPKITAYHIKLGQNKKLYQAILTISQSSTYKRLNAQQKKVISNMLRDFKLGGIDLDKNNQKKYTALQKELSKLQNKFSDNVLDATNAWNKLIKVEKELLGLPAHIVAAAKANAENKKLIGWLLTLHAPFLEAVLTYADNRTLRKEVYLAFVTRASMFGAHPKKFDNTKIIPHILDIRYKIALLLGFNNYAELSLFANKMVPTTKKVLAFLNDLGKCSRKKAKSEFMELQKFATKYYKIKKLEPWDISYYSEKLRIHSYDFSNDEVRKYFPCDKVLSGLFLFLQKLYGISFKEIKNFASWDSEVRCFKILNNKNREIGKIYMDLYARPNKQGGAWMDSCRTRRILENGKIQNPIAYLVCNFAPPVKNQKTLLTHNEVDTLFHEMGHCLQHLLTEVDYAPVSGINGVPWDAVEFASQFMENWCFEKDVLKNMTSHEKTKKPLPNELFNKIIKAKNMQSGLCIARQLELAIFDFRLHVEFNPKEKNQTQKILDAVRKKVAVVPVYKNNRFQNSFLHIFAGAYAAGYYSYKWAEVLACDAFYQFKKKGLFDKKTANLFLKYILASGGALEPMEAFKKFCGREPSIAALLKMNEIT